MLIVQVAITLQGTNSSFIGQVMFCFVFFFSTKMSKRYIPTSLTPDMLVGEPKFKVLTGALSFLLSQKIQSWELLSQQARQEIDNMRQVTAAENYIL